MAPPRLLIAAAVATLLVQPAAAQWPNSTSLPWLSVAPIDKSVAPASARDYKLVDEWGREVNFRGACIENEERNLPGVNTQRPVDPDLYVGTCPPNYQSYQEPPICQVDAGKGRFAANTSDSAHNDIAQLRALGMNIFRFCLSWSELEPTPGTYSQMYINRVLQVVDWAEEQGVYLILDMHEDLYSTFIQYNATHDGPGIPNLLTPASGADGAPAWAVDTWNLPSLALLGIGNLNLAVMAAFQSFYDNEVLPGVPQGSAPGPGLQDHYIGAIAALAAAVKGRSVVAGFEIINEPNPGIVLDPFTFASSYLYPLYSRTVQAITGVRDGLPTCNATAATTTPSPAYLAALASAATDGGAAAKSLKATGSPLGAGGLLLTGVQCAYADLGIHDTQHIFFAEPSALRNTLDFSAMIPEPWTSYPNIVHTPHTYTHVFTIDQELPWLNLTWWPPSFDFAYQSAVWEANGMNSATFVTEYGDGVQADAQLVTPTIEASERALVGGTLWSWKSNCGGPTGACDNTSWTVYQPADGPFGSAVEQNGPLYADRELVQSRVHSRGALGEFLHSNYFSENSSYTGALNVSSATAERVARTAAAEAANAVAACARTASALHSGAPLNSLDFEGWCGAGVVSGASPAAPLRIVVDPPTSFHPSLPRRLAANGTVSEWYLPRSLNASRELLVGGAAVVVGQVTWPDGSRSVYIRPTGPGVHTVSLPPEGSSAAGAAGGADAELAAIARAPPAAAVDPLQHPGAQAALDAWMQVVESARAVAQEAGLALPGPGGRR